MKILIVDDNAVLCKLYARELAKEGYEARTVQNGQRALELVHEEKPDLVVLDIRMPGMDGVRVLDQIREEDSELAVVINSSYNSYQDNFLTWSADAFLIKSADLSELKTTIRSLLEQKASCCP
ncbi:MAG: response regulator [Planctomycetes bacterium]|nr:response regulator [Planctomycetota bacterium]